MATVVNMFPDVRAEAYGNAITSIGENVAKSIEKRRQRRELEERQKALQELLTAPSEELGGPSPGLLLSKSMELGLKPNEAISLLQERNKQEKEKNMESDFSDFFMFTEQGMSNEEALAAIGNPDLAQPLSQAGIGAGDETISLYKKTGEERQVRVPKGIRLSDETVRIVAPEAYGLGFNLTKPAPRQPGSESKPSESDKDVIALLKARGVPDNETNRARGRLFLIQGPAAVKQIESRYGKFDKESLTYFIEPGIALDKATEARAIFEDIFFSGSETKSTGRASSEAIQEANRRVDNLEHVSGGDLNEVASDLKDRGWTSDEVRSGLSKKGLSEEKIDAVILRVFKEAHVKKKKN